jgi:hypothetical protein
MRRHRSPERSENPPPEDTTSKEKSKSSLIGQKRHGGRIFRSCFNLLSLCLLVSGVVYYGFHSGLLDYDFEYIDMGLITPDISLLFDKYDTNADGKLDIFEFEPLAHHLQSIKVGQKIL